MDPSHVAKTQFITIVIIVLIVICVPLAFGYIYVKTQTKKIKANWSSYRCNPFVIPFAGMVGPPGTSVSGNSSACISTMATNVFNTLMEPFIKIIETIFGILSMLVKNAQDTRKMMFYLRSNLKDIAGDVYGRIENVYYRVAYLFKTIQRLLVHVFYIFRNLFEVLKYSYYSLKSLYNGPIGFLMGCFDASTVITKDDGSKCAISEIKIGDVLQGGSEVTGVMKYSSLNASMFSYKGIKVSGDHAVKEKDKYIRIRDSKKAKPINSAVSEYIYCLHTSDSKIMIGDIEFMDYYESNDTIIHKMILNYILTRLNKTINPGVPLHKNFVCAFSKDTVINGKTICDYKIGDFLEDGSIITGIIETCKNTDVYEKDGIKCTGRQLVYSDRLWIPVSQAEGWLKVVEEDTMYNLTTTSGIIQIGKIKFRDFNEVDDGGFIDMIMLDYCKNR